MKLRKWTKPEATYALGVVLFAPTVLWYFFIALQWPIVGLLCYAAFAGFTYIGGGFDFYKEWPRSAKITLWAGPVLLMVGFFFYYLFSDLSEWRHREALAMTLLWIPLVPYFIIAVIANHKLRCKFGMSAGGHLQPPKPSKRDGDEGRK